MKFVAIALLSCLASPAIAQTPAMGTLRVTVVDPSSAVIVGATVTVIGADDGASASRAPVQTSDSGTATVPGLPPGRYTIQAEFPGVETKRIAHALGRPVD